MAVGDEAMSLVRADYQREFEPGAVVFDEGDAGDHLYVIQTGEIELTREGSTGQRVIAHLGPGDFFGELGAVLGKRSSTRAVAIKRSKVLQLDRETLEAMCLDQPGIAIRLLRVVVARLIEAERRLAELCVDDLLRPVVRGLLRAARPDSGRGARIPTTLRKLAEGAGLPLIETHRVLHQLFDEKLIRLEDDCLIAADLEALSAHLDAREA